MIGFAVGLTIGAVAGGIAGAWFVWRAYQGVLDGTHDALRDVLMNPGNAQIRADAWDMVRALDGTKS